MGFEPILVGLEPTVLAKIILNTQIHIGVRGFEPLLAGPKPTVLSKLY